MSKENGTKTEPKTIHRLKYLIKKHPKFKFVDCRRNGVSYGGEIRQMPYWTTFGLF